MQYFWLNTVSSCGLGESSSRVAMPEEESLVLWKTIQVFHCCLPGKFWQAFVLSSSVRNSQNGRGRRRQKLRKQQTKETTEEKPKESGGLLDEEACSKDCKVLHAALLLGWRKLGVWRLLLTIRLQVHLVLTFEDFNWWFHRIELRVWWGASTDCGK